MRTETTTKGRERTNRQVPLHDREARALRLRREGLLRLRQQADRAGEELQNLRRGEPDMLDQAAEDEQASVARDLSERELKELREIDAALGRLEGGGYGRCESCGRSIPRRRLRAIPEARRCAGCARAS